LGLGPDEVGQNGLKLLQLWHHSQKIWHPKPWNSFFHWRVKEKTVFWGFKQLFSTIAWWVMQLLRHMKLVI